MSSNPGGFAGIRPPQLPDNARTDAANAGKKGRGPKRNLRTFFNLKFQNGLRQEFSGAKFPESGTAYKYLKPD